MRKLGLFFALLAMLTACATEYRYIPPGTASGQACVRKCWDERQNCAAIENQNAQSRYAVCVARANTEMLQCERDAAVQYAACLKNTSDREEKKCHLRHCSEPYCSDRGDTSACESDYRLCFQSCGGVIQEVK